MNCKDSDQTASVYRQTWAQLFKSNDVVKTLIIKYGIYANIFAEKNMSSFCICKSCSHFFSKITCELSIVLSRTVKISTTNKLIKLTMLWKTGPWLLAGCTCQNVHFSHVVAYFKRLFFFFTNDILKCFLPIFLRNLGLTFYANRLLYVSLKFGVVS